MRAAGLIQLVWPPSGLAILRKGSPELAQRSGPLLVQVDVVDVPKGLEKSIKKFIQLGSTSTTSTRSGSRAIVPRNPSYDDDEYESDDSIVEA